jgi:hypothetical protein
MIGYFMDFIYALSIVGILAGLALIIDAIRRLTEQTAEPPRGSGPKMTWIYWQEPTRVPSRRTNFEGR